MMRFLACGGGTNVTDAVGRAFSKLLTHDMQVKVTMSGSNMKERILEELGLLPQGKFSFADTFLPTFIKAIRLVFKDNPPTEQEVQSAASSFLRRATDREGGRERRRKSAEKKAQTANSRNGNVTQPPPKKKRLCLDESDSDSA